ncbi:YunG family protein [Streptomyces sp. NPDC054933]
MTPWTLVDIERAVRSSWSAETCSPDDLAEWNPRNSARGQCDITALVVQDIFGGDLVLGEVRVHGERTGYHWWNRLPSGCEIDLTREQFGPHEVVVGGRAVPRPPGPPARRREAYELLRGRVIDWLGPIPGPGAG